MLPVVSFGMLRGEGYWPRGLRTADTSDVKNWIYDWQKAAQTVNNNSDVIVN